MEEGRGEGKDVPIQLSLSNLQTYISRSTCFPKSRKSEIRPIRE